MSILLAALASSEASEERRTKWLSTVIQEMWPYIIKVVRKMGPEILEPALSANMPSGLPMPTIREFFIGNEPLMVKSVSVFERRYGGKKAFPVIEADILYDGKPSIQMLLGGYGFGVSDAKVEGRVEILLRPLLDEVPLFGAVQIGFINRPQIDYTLSGAAAIANFASIKRIMRTVVEDVFASIAVLPRRIAFKLVPTADYFEFVADPTCILRIALLSGKGFPMTDRHILKQALGQSEEPDVYVTLRLGSTVHESDRVNDRADPIWENQVFDFVLTTDSAAQEIQMEAYDDDVGTDDFLGSAEILLSKLAEPGVREVELVGAPEDAQPTIKLIGRKLELSTDLHDIQKAIISQRNERRRPKHCSSLVLSIDVDEAHNLPPVRRPFVRVRVAEKRYETSALSPLQSHLAIGNPQNKHFSVPDPDFEQSFHIPLESCVDTSAQIVYQVLDWKTGNLLGHAHSPLSDALTAGAGGKTYDFALLDCKNLHASLRVRVRLSAVRNVNNEPPLWEELGEPFKH